MKEEKIIVLRITKDFSKLDEKISNGYYVTRVKFNKEQLIYYLDKREEKCTIY